MIVANQDRTRGCDPALQIVRRENRVVLAEVLREFAQVSASVASVLRANVIPHGRQGMHLRRRSPQLLS
jgi:hypothetical protein